MLRALQSRLLKAMSMVCNGAALLAALKLPEKEALSAVAPAEAEPSKGERERLLSSVQWPT